MGEKRKRSASPERREKVNDSSRQAAKREMPSPHSTSNPLQSTTEPQLPLTTSNLRQLNQETMPKESVQDAKSNANTASSGKSKESGNTVEMGMRLLDHNGMMINDEAAWERNPQLAKAAKGILDQPRYNLMGPGSPEKIKQAWKDGSQLNESTFMITFWIETLIKNDRETVELVEESRSPGKKQENQTMSRPWRSDGLQKQFDRQWKVGVVPLVDNENDPLLEKVKASLPKVTIPKPDISHGLWHDAFNEDENNIIISDRDVTELLPTQYHTFFIVEFKGKDGLIAEARLQARRAGAAMVKAMRDWRARYKFEQPQPGEAEDTFAFSICLQPEFAEIYVHWAEKDKNGRVRYHMNCIRDTFLKHDDGRETARRYIYNMLDWGCTTRKYEIKKLLARMKAQIEKQPEPKKQKTAPS